MKRTTIAEKIRQARLRARLTQEQAAQLVGIDSSVLSRYECGIVIPPADKYEALLEIGRTARGAKIKKSKRKLKNASFADNSK